MDRYYTPFITPKKGKSFTTREWNDIAAEHNQNIAVVPQILTNQAEGFCKVAGMLKEQGYEEVNLNLGCPSATVTAKKKGAGFLADPDALDAFLEEIYPVIPSSGANSYCMRFSRSNNPAKTPPAHSC